jgi:hypothetical protein
MTISFILEKNQAKQAWHETKLLQSCYPSEESGKTSHPPRHKVKRHMAENYNRGPDWGLSCFSRAALGKCWDTNFKKTATASFHIISNS